MPRRRPAATTWSPGDQSDPAVELLPGFTSIEQDGRHEVTAGTVRIDDAALPYIVELDLVMTEAGVTCERLAAERRSDGIEIGSQALRQLKVPELLARASAKVWAVEGAPTLSAYIEARLAHTGDLVAKRSTVGERIDPETFTAFVELYKACQRRAGWNYVTKAKAELNLSESTAHRWRRRAIKEGLVTP